ncbi:hypothetical protein GGX14DRAFT_387612 [Mycena pura]|uniref:Uncharacterized protein n=1 Tax=Mycena pura TaxID=153505 RepID=A0AAD6YLT7_9AGAR|nr:hypothetical protein GGX14DRAFT_387612 [Mycena pura]
MHKYWVGILQNPILMHEIPDPPDDVSSVLFKVLVQFWRNIWHQLWLILAPEYGLACSGAIYLTFVARTISGMLVLLAALVLDEPGFLIGGNNNGQQVLGTKEL